MVAALSENVHERERDEQERENNVNDVGNEHPKAVDNRAESENFTERPVRGKQPSGKDGCRKENEVHQFDDSVDESKRSFGAVFLFRLGGGLSPFRRLSLGSGRIRALHPSGGNRDRLSFGHYRFRKAGTDQPRNRRDGDEGSRTDLFRAEEIGNPHSEIHTHDDKNLVLSPLNHILPERANSRKPFRLTVSGNC